MASRRRGGRWKEEEEAAVSATTHEEQIAAAAAACENDLREMDPETRKAVEAKEKALKEKAKNKK
ncbi:hypothetical protein NW752_005708 [Fusarium irregulare]|uniref:Uncharacterized protein n=1 Tax=Fusarium irregulare TaxID=2494466 RepID=A0A9W8UAW1_9HYPO|nr:hypothetical protein NW766_006241 [Fusarium irregulare]KAJ4018584.1 hypothetical protein NW752_005708 [Fusarium irregulare]